jgi:hypothetical protein
MDHRHANGMQFFTVVTLALLWSQSNFNWWVFAALFATAPWVELGIVWLYRWLRAPVAAKTEDTLPAPGGPAPALRKLANPPPPLTASEFAQEDYVVTRIRG